MPVGLIMMHKKNRSLSSVKERLHCFFCVHNIFTGSRPDKNTPLCLLLSRGGPSGDGEGAGAASGSLAGCPEAKGLAGPGEGRTLGSGLVLFLPGVLGAAGWPSLAAGSLPVSGSLVSFVGWPEAEGLPAAAVGPLPGTGLLGSVVLSSGSGDLVAASLFGF